MKPEIGSGDVGADVDAAQSSAFPGRDNVCAERDRGWVGAGCSPPSTYGCEPFNVSAFELDELAECVIACGLDFGRSRTRVVPGSALCANGAALDDVDPGIGGTGGTSSIDREKKADEFADVADVMGVMGVNSSPMYDAPDPEPFDPDSEVTPLCVSQ